MTQKILHNVLLLCLVSIIAISAKAQENARQVSDVSLWKTVPVSEDNSGVAELKSVKVSTFKSYVIETEGFHGRPATQKYFLDQLQLRLNGKTKLKFGEGELTNYIYAYDVANVSKVEFFEIVRRTRIEVLNKVRSFGSSEKAEIEFGGNVTLD